VWRGIKDEQPFRQVVGLQTNEMQKKISGEKSGEGPSVTRLGKGTRRRKRGNRNQVHFLQAKEAREESWKRKKHREERGFVYLHGVGELPRWGRAAALQRAMEKRDAGKGDLEDQKFRKGSAGNLKEARTESNSFRKKKGGRDDGDENKKERKEKKKKKKKKWTMQR